MGSASIKGYTPAREASYKWGVLESRVHNLSQQGRIPGLEHIGRSWVIPENAGKPTDPRHNTCINTGKEASNADEQ